jgi:hypothetical protein
MDSRSSARQRDALLGLSVAAICTLCRVNRTTAARWKQGRARMPFAAFVLVRMAFEGFLPPGVGWDGWRFGADGRLYAPDIKPGYLPEHIRALDVLWPMFTWSERLRELVTSTQKNRHCVS